MSTGSAPRRGLAPQRPSLNIVLEFARAEAAASPHAFRFAAQQYLVRTPGGGIEAAELPWTPALLADLAALREPGPPAATVHGLGHVLRDFLAGTGWAAHEQAIVAAAQAGAPIRVTIRSAAAELYALPWELLALKSSGQLLGGVPGLVIRYEWPETQSAPDPMPGSSRVGRTLLAWSAAGGAVPAADHVSALSTSFGPLRFDPKRDVLAHTSLAALAAALQRARSEDPAIDVLYLLSHGAAHGGNYGMVLDGADALDGPALVDAGRLQQLIAPHAGMLRMVVIAACDGANAGTPGNHLGSVAQMIHRAGIPVVIASRTPLRASAASRMCAALFGSLATQTGLLTAFLAVRDALMHDATALDWANVQLYARAADGEPSLPPGPGERRPAPPRDGPRWPRIRPWTAVGAASTALVLSAWHLAPGGGQTDPQPPTPPATARASVKSSSSPRTAPW